MLTEQEKQMFYRARAWMNAPHGPTDDIWGIDGAAIEPQDEDSYDTVFSLPLKDQGVTSFEGLMTQRRAMGRDTNVLDLFGGGFFVADYLDMIDSITGVRLTDPTEEMLANIRRNSVAQQANAGGTTDRFDRVCNRITLLRESPKWKIIAGSSYQGKTWEDLDTSSAQRKINSFGVVVIKPEGMFSSGPIFDLEDKNKTPTRDKVYSLPFLRMVDRVYARLSPQDGILFSDVPHFIAQTYLDPFIDILQSNGINAKRHEGKRTQLTIQRTSPARVSLEKLVERKFF